MFIFGWTTRLVRLHWFPFGFRCLVVLFSFSLYTFHVLRVRVCVMSRSWMKAAGRLPDTNSSFHLTYHRTRREVDNNNNNTFRFVCCTIFWQFDGYSALWNHQNGVGGIFAASNCFWPLELNADGLEVRVHDPTDQGVDLAFTCFTSRGMEMRREIQQPIFIADDFNSRFKYGKNIRKNWSFIPSRTWTHEFNLFSRLTSNAMVYAWSIKYDSEIRPPTQLFQSFAIHWPLARLLAVAAEVKHNKTSIFTLFLHSFHFPLIPCSHCVPFVVSMRCNMSSLTSLKQRKGNHSR